MISILTWGLPFVLMGLALTCSAPGIVGGDSAELTAAAFNFGSAHAPGYPLFITFGHLFQLLPLGTPAFRLTFFSILVQCAAFLLLTWTLKDLSAAASNEASASKKGEGRTQGELAFLTASLVFAGPLMFHQMVSPEVFALHLLFAALLLRMVLFPNPVHFLGVSFLAGIALSHQHLTLLILPALGWAYRKEWQDGKKLTRAAAVLLLGLSPYLILCLRAAQSPLVNWGNPSTFGQFMYHVTRTQYGGDITQGSLLSGVMDFYLVAKDSVLESFGLGLLVLFIGLLKNRRGLKTEYFIGLFCLFVLLPFLIRGEYNSENNHINGAFIPPAFLWVSPLILKGLEWILGKKKPLKTILLSVFWSFIGALALFSCFQNNERRNLAAEDIGLDILSQLPRHSVLFSSGDSITFPLAYLKLVQHFRPDVDIFDQTGGLFPDIYHLLNYQNEPGSVPPLAVAEEKFKNQHQPSAVFYSEKIDNPGLPLTMNGLLFRESRDGKQPPLDETLWGEFRMPRVELSNDYFSRESAARYYLFKAQYELDIEKNDARGEENLKTAKDLSFDNSRLMLNAGVAENTHGWTDQAALSFEKASDLAPYNFLAWFDRGILAENQKKPEALLYFRKAAQFNPKSADAHQHLGYQYYQAGLFDQATEQWELVRKIDPSYAEAYRSLGYMAMQTKPAYAAQMFAEYLHLVPNPPDKATMVNWVATHPHL